MDVAPFVTPVAESPAFQRGWREASRSSASWALDGSMMDPSMQQQVFNDFGQLVAAVRPPKNPTPRRSLPSHDRNCTEGATRVEPQRNSSQTAPRARNPQLSRTSD